MSTIGKRIKDRRLALRLSVDEVALRLGKNRATVYRYESDEIENMPLGVIAPLAEVLETTPGYLMGWSINEKEPATENDDGLNEIVEIFSKLSADNRSKFLELGRLYLGAQNSPEGTE